MYLMGKTDIKLQLVAARVQIYIKCNMKAQKKKNIPLFVRLSTKVVTYE